MAAPTTAEFRMRPGEKIVHMRLKESGTYLTQLTLTTNYGRVLGPYGGDEGVTYSLYHENQMMYNDEPSSLAFFKGHYCVECDGFGALHSIQVAWSNAPWKC